MFKEEIKNNLVEQWVEQQGYAIASQRVERLAQMLMHYNPEFRTGEFARLSALDIGCGGQPEAQIASEHNYEGSELWEPWFNRILWLINAQRVDGIDVVPQTDLDRENGVYFHRVFDLYNGFASGIEMQNILRTPAEQYNLINCTHVVNPDNPSPYLENLVNKLGLSSDFDSIIAELIEYIKKYALYSLTENGLLAIDNLYYIKRGGKLLRLQK